MEDGDTHATDDLPPPLPRSPADTIHDSRSTIHFPSTVHHAPSTLLIRHWFLITLGLLIVGGWGLGLSRHGETVQASLWLLNPRWITAGVLFLMAFSLNTHTLRQAFLSPAPVILGFALNYGFVPLMAWWLMSVQTHDDFRLGLMIAASVPCTTAAASVMTRKAKGNDAVSLLITVSTNGLCFVLTPLWLRATTSQQVDLDVVRLMLDLVVAVLLPTILGQILRQPAAVADFATRHKTPIGVAAQVLIESIVFVASVNAGVKWVQVGSGTESPITLAAVGIAWGTCLVIHLSSLAIGYFGARSLRFEPANQTPVAFAASQKTLPIGLYISSDPKLFGLSHPFAVFPMLMYHASQLFLDTWLATRMAGRVESRESKVESEQDRPG
jgi:sodium/bile acid cotransporter 7